MRVFNRFALGDQGFVIEHALGRFAVTGINHQADALGLDSHLGPQFLEGVIDDQHAGLRVIQGVDDLGRAPADVDRIEHGIGPRYCLVVLDVALGVEREHRYTLATGHAQALERASQPGNAIAQLGESHTAALITNCRGIGALLPMALQPLGHVHRNLQSCFCRELTCEVSCRW
ncbi:hypothetical protein D3C81_1715260 [compost metagenome]